MIRRLLTAGLLTWAVMLLPSLCLTGRLQHDCACGDERRCAHETGCAGDPCAIARPAPAAGESQQAAGPALVPSASLEWFRVPLRVEARRMLAAAASSLVSRPELRTGARPLLA